MDIHLLFKGKIGYFKEHSLKRTAADKRRIDRYPASCKHRVLDKLKYTWLIIEHFQHVDRDNLSTVSLKMKK